MVIVGGLAAFVPARVAGEMTSIGTLFAFTLVCAAVLIVRKVCLTYIVPLKLLCSHGTDFRHPYLPLYDVVSSG